MATVIAPVTDEEHEELARLVLRAFSPLLFHQRIFGNVDPATYVDFLAAQARSDLKDPHCEMAKATREGKIVGFVRWITPKETNAHVERKAGDAISTSPQGRRYPPEANVELGRELLEVPEKEIPEPHFRIGLLAVDPGAQGARVGSALLRHVCRQADEQGVVVYLKASPESMSLSRRFGFRQHGEPHRAASAPELALYPMLRKPVELAPATVQDLAVLAPIHRCAFAPMPVTRYLRTSAKPAVLEESFQRRFAKATSYSVLYGACANRQQRTGHLCQTLSRTENYITPGYDPVRKRDFDVMLMQHAQSIPFMRWTLLNIAVDPAAQGAGVGKRLVRSVIERAASDGLPVVLEAEEERIPLYMSAGFELFGDALVAAEDSTVKLRPMVLKTQKASESAQS